MAEDLTLLRDGLIRMLEAYGFEVVAAVDNGPDLQRALIGERPDVAVVDVRLPPTHTDEGLRAALNARAEIPGLPVLVLSQYVERLYARELLADGNGGIGYLLKDRVSDGVLLVDALNRLVEGETVIDPTIVSRVFARRRRVDPLAELTPREREVLALLTEGMSNSALAARLHVTERTVEAHITAIFAKLGLADEPGVHRRVLAVLTFLRA